MISKFQFQIYFKKMVISLKKTEKKALNAKIAKNDLKMTFWWPWWPFKGQGGILESNGWFHWTQGVKTYRKRGVNIHFSSKNKNSMITSFFRWRPSWIAYCHLMPGFQDGYLIEKCDLGSLVPETIIKLRGPHRVSWVYC